MPKEPLAFLCDDAQGLDLAPFAAGKALADADVDGARTQIAIVLDVEQTTRKTEDQAHDVGVVGRGAHHRRLDGIARRDLTGVVARERPDELDAQGLLEHLLRVEGHWIVVRSTLANLDLDVVEVVDRRVAQPQVLDLNWAVAEGEERAHVLIVAHDLGVGGGGEGRRHAVLTQQVGDRLVAAHLVGPAGQRIGGGGTIRAIVRRRGRRDKAVDQQPTGQLQPEAREAELGGGVAGAEQRAGDGRCQGNGGDGNHGQQDRPQPVLARHHAQHHLDAGFRSNMRPEVLRYRTGRLGRDQHDAQLAEIPGRCTRKRCGNDLADGQALGHGHCRPRLARIREGRQKHLLPRAGHVRASCRKAPTRRADQ